MRVGLAATTAPWSAALRSYVRDHSQDVSIEVVMDRPGLEKALGGLDVLVLDDIMRTFSVADISRAESYGVHVVGVFDQARGAGHQYVSGLGPDQVLPASLSPAELLAAVREAVESRPKLRALYRSEEGAFVPEGDGNGRRGPGVVGAWTKVSGGAGLSEALVAAAEQLSRRGRVLLVEAEEVAPVMLSRLSRSPEGGLPWALSRAAQGLPALPEALSPPRPGAPGPVGHFDVVCAAPTIAQPINPFELERFLGEATLRYNYVLVETSWLVGLGGARQRPSSALAVLRLAASIVVLAAADPEGAGRLVQWKAAALAAGVGAPAFAAFGRARSSRYEREHLRSVVESNTGRHRFAGFAFLPEDPAVGRARWNGELVRRGAFFDAVRELTAKSVSAVAPVGGGPGETLGGPTGPRQRGDNVALAAASNGSGRT
ncbi:MAG: hypothetical protein M0005_05175 [Actinomycetota bacterium]|nr:hypothetical protein [Actinomycetota bacterium]